MGKLYVVPTPIGNLKDITQRALETLNEVDFILAEDTRTSSKLLSHYQISTKCYAHHKFNEHHTIEMVSRRIAAGETAALISDAGTPSISDPGFLLVRKCLADGIAVETLPGAVAFVPALVNSGLPSERFVFEGFLPAKKGRQKRMEFLQHETRTMIFYESPHRLLKTLSQLAEHMGSDRRASVSRELTKMYEETQSSTLAELITYYNTGPIKGEIVLVVEGETKKKKQQHD